MRARGGLFRYSIFRRFAIVVACVLAASGLALAGSGKASASGGLSATWTSWLNSGIETYGDTSAGWTSGDNAVQVPLGGGQDLWMFNDSFYGSVNAVGGANQFGMHFIHNMDLLSSGSGSSFSVNATITGPLNPSNGIPSAAVTAPSGLYAWPADGYVSGGNVVAMYNDFGYQSGASGSDYMPLQTQVVSTPVSEFTNPSTYTPPMPVNGPNSNCTTSGGDCVQWGVSMINSTSCPAVTPALPSCTYLFGEVWAPGDKGQHQLAEAVTAEGLGSSTYYYYHGPGSWTTSSADLDYPLGNVSTSAFSAYQVSSGSYVAVDSTGGGVTAYYSSTPDFTSTTSAQLFNQPSGPPGSMTGELAYQFHIEPDYSSGSSVVMGFSVDNISDPQPEDQACLQYTPYADINTYQPEFFSFTLPATATAVQAAGAGMLTTPLSYEGVGGEQTGCLSTVPTPSAFEANYAGSGNINLSWTDTGGLYEYNVRREDVDSTSPTWTQFQYAVWDSPCSSGSDFNCVTDNANLADLIPGHTYFYELETDNWKGANTGWDLGISVTLPAKITGTSDKLCASVAYNSTQNGAGLDQETCTGNYSAQEWQYTPAQVDPNGDEDYQVGSLNGTNYCMEATGIATDDAIVQATCPTSNDLLDLWEAPDRGHHQLRP